MSSLSIEQASRLLPPEVTRRSRGRPRKNNNINNKRKRSADDINDGDSSPNRLTDSRSSSHINSNNNHNHNEKHNRHQQQRKESSFAEHSHKTASTSSSKSKSKDDVSTARLSRARKERKLYSDDWALEDDDINDGNINVFSIVDKLESDKFSQSFVREMRGADFTVAYLQRHGFNTPLLFKEKTGLGLQVPSQTFSVNDVRTCVGSRRILDVMDVSTQKNFEMSMKEWQKYYDDPDKNKRLLNVISLEFSHTRLENYVKRPSIVRLIDWVDCVWPKHLKDAQTETTNTMEDMKYPKVQKYCLMSVKGCYTDFHIDLGGTSVWYHILKGVKVFWLIPPTDENIELYERWVLSGKQNDIFFGDTVEKCSRIILTEGNTFFIPTGWIHAVYTMKDSLVFGGNFLHSFGIEKQLRAAKVEDTIKVPYQFRYPFFTEMLWYVLERYVYILLGKSYLRERDVSRRSIKEEKEHVHLTKCELHGLKEIIKYVYTLPSNKKNVPDLIDDAINLIRDVRELIQIHCHDNPELAITGKPVIPTHKSELKRERMLESHEMIKQEDGQPEIKIAKVKTSRTSMNGPRRRRTRCKNCQACKQSDCGECPFCQDMVKFGGPGKAKQTCVMRQCLQPMLPVTAACLLCGLDGWGQQIVVPITKAPKETPSSLMECSVCYEILHPDCIAKKIPDIEGVVNEDLPNSWECPKCCKDGKNIEYKPRHFRARNKTSDNRKASDSDYSDTEGNSTRSSSVTSNAPSIISPNKRKRSKSIETPKLGENSPGSNISIPVPESSPDEPPLKKTEVPEMPKVIDTATVTVVSEPATNVPTMISPPSPILAPPAPVPEPRKLALRTQLANQLTGNTTKPMKKPQYPVRPAANKSTVAAADNTSEIPSYMTRDALVCVFRCLSTADIGRCARVCKAWANICIDSKLWEKIDLTNNKRLTAGCLAGIVKRQPVSLIFDWTWVAKRQLEWVIARLPQLRELSLQGCPSNAVSALRTCNCPPLTSLDLSSVTGMNDAALRDILSPPKDSRPGLVDTKSRLRNLKVLKLSGCQISDVSLRYIVQNLPNLTTLDLSNCFRLTDAGIAQLTTSPASTISTLVWFDLSGCTMITDTALDNLSKCTALKHLDLRGTTQITPNAVERFLNLKMGYAVKDDKLIVKEKYESEMFID